MVGALGALAWLAGTSSPDAQQTPAFRATVDLVAVTVQVVDADGRPVSGLSREHFDVTIDGKNRRVVSSDLIQAGGLAPLRADDGGAGASDRRDRTFVLAIDAASFEPGEALGIIEAAQGFVKRLGPGDAVGVFPLSPSRSRVDPTMDRLAVHMALGRLTGQRSAASSQFNLTTSEIIDIMAEANSRGTPIVSGPPTTGRGAPPPPPIALDSNTLERVQVRECRQTNDQGCAQAIVSEAAALAQQLEERVRESLNGLDNLLDALQQYPGRKTVVVMSGGMAVSDRPGGRVDIGDEAGDLGERAARANAVIYALHVDASMSRSFSAQARRIRDLRSLARERTLSSKLLDEFSGETGGGLLPVNVGGGDLALERVLRETSAYYLLGVEPGTAERDGKAHRLRVKISQKGATVRSRQWVVLPKARRRVEVLDQEQPALARAHDVEIAIAIDVDDRNLHAGADAATVVDQVPDPFHRRRRARVSRSMTAGAAGTRTNTRRAARVLPDRCRCAP